MQKGPQQQTLYKRGKEHNAFRNESHMLRGSIQSFLALENQNVLDITALSRSLPEHISSEDLVGARYKAHLNSLS